MNMISRFRQVFSCDLRSLAVFRILFGVYIMADTLSRGQNLTRHYTDEGIFPTPLARVVLDTLNTWSLHALSGSAAFQLLLFALTFFAGLCIALGYRTFWASLAGYLLLISMQNRFIVAPYPGDYISRTAGLIALFAPLGSVWSLDARGKRPENMYYFGPGSVLINIFPVLFLFYTGLSKIGGSWIDGSAVYWSISSIGHNRHVLDFLTDHFEVTRWLTWKTIFMERVASLLILTPFWIGPVRTALILYVCSVLAVFLIALDVWLFPYMLIGLFTAMLPPWFWDFAIKRPRPARYSPPEPSELRQSPRTRRLLWVLGMLLAFAILSDNARKIGEAGYYDTKYVRPPAFLDVTIRHLGVRNEWLMFRFPEKNLSGWDVIAATLASGEQINAVTGRPLDFEVPRDPPSIIGGFRDKRMFKYANWKEPGVIDRWDDFISPMYMYIAKYHCRRLGNVQAISIWRAHVEMKLPPEKTGEKTVEKMIEIPCAEALNFEYAKPPDAGNG